MKTILVLGILHVLVCLIVGYFSVKKSRVENCFKTDDIIQKINETEDASSMSTDGFLIGRTMVSYSFDRAVVFYALAGLLGLIVATVFEISGW